MLHAFRASSFTRRLLPWLPFFIALVQAIQSGEISESHIEPEARNDKLINFPDMQFWWQTTLELDKSPNFRPNESYAETFLQTFTIDEKITQEFIQTRVIGRQSDKERVSALLWHIMETSTEAKENYELIFKYLPEFRIRVISSEQMEMFHASKEGQLRAVTIPSLTELKIPSEELESSYKSIVNIFRHEMDHVFRMFLCESLGFNSVVDDYWGSYALTLPDDNMWKQCDQRIEKIEFMLLEKLYNRNLSEEDEKLLEHYRNVTKNQILEDDLIYAEDCSYDLEFQFDSLEELNEMVNSNFSIGSIINLDEDYHSTNKTGKLYVANVWLTREKNRVKVLGVPLDPLSRIILFNNKIKSIINEHYINEDYSLERSAHLRQYYKEAILKAIFTEVYLFDVNLYQKAKQKMALTTPRNDCFFDDAYRYAIISQRISFDIRHQKYSNINKDDAIDLAEAYVRRGHPIWAIDFLKLNEEICSVYCFTIFAEAYFSLGHFETANKYYESFFSRRNQVLDNREDALIYAKSLYRKNSFQLAEKYYHMACDNLEEEREIDESFTQACVQVKRGMTFGF